MRSNTIIKTARIAGFLYFLQIPLAVFSILYVPNTLLVAGDAAATANNILTHESIFRLSIISALLNALVTAATAIALYKVLKPVGEGAALMMVIFTLVAAPMAMLNELNKVAILLLLKGPEYLPAFTEAQLQSLVPLFFDLHKYGIQIVGIFWGLWLFPMGYLAFKSNYIPKIVGVFLMIACFGYLADSFIFFMNPNTGIVISAVTSSTAETFMVLWLLIKGVNVKEWEKWTLASGKPES